MSRKIAALVLFVLPLLGLGLLQAQEVKELARHPGDVLKFEVKLDGPDADKVNTISPLLILKGTTPTSQPGFKSAMGGDNFRAVAPRQFRPTITIPENAMTGDYFLVINIEASPFQLRYTAGEQFQMHPFHIENPKAFTPPKVTVKELP